MQANATETTYADIHSPTGSRVFHIRIDRHWDGVAITVAHHDILDRQFGNPAEADAYLQLLETEATKGTQVFLIEAKAGAWTSAAAVVDQAEQEMVAGINERMDAAQPQPVDVSDIVQGDGYQAERARARRQAALRNTRSRAHLKPPTPAERARIRAHKGGIVTCGPGQNWTLLRAIERKRLAEVHEVYGGCAIRSLKLNARGWALIESEVAA